MTAYEITPRMRRVLQVARSEASRLGHTEIDAAHLLLALVGADGQVRRLLEQAGVDGAVVRRRLLAILPATAPGQRTADLPYSAHAREILVLARQAAERLRSPRVEPGHLLLGLLNLETSPATRVLAATGLDGEAVESAIRKQP